MVTYDEKRECKSVTGEQKHEPVFNLLGQSYDLTKKALAMAMRINANFFGKQEKEQNPEPPCCMCDAIVQHVDELKALCEELDDILSGLGA